MDKGARLPRGVVRPAAGILGVGLFIVALEAIKAGAAGIEPLLDALSVGGAANSVGFGWLAAYVALSGSPVAAVSITLLAGEVIPREEAFAMVGGSRLGASFIVLMVGFVMYLAHRRDPDGLYIGVVALLTTFTTQGPAILLGLWSLRQGWLDGAAFGSPVGLTGGVEQVVGPIIDLYPAGWPDGGLFGFGVAMLLLSFSVFDRAIPQLEAEAEGITRILDVLSRRPMMFLLGSAVTATTMSVSISLTVLVPLSLKGLVRRDHIIPYVMGANITTFIDTLFASAVLGGEEAFVVVLTEMVTIALVSLVLLTLMYGRYATAILACAHWITVRPRNFSVFLGAIVGAPLLLLLV